MCFAAFSMLNTHLLNEEISVVDKITMNNYEGTVYNLNSEPTYLS
jgi:hypothetical protein